MYSNCTFFERNHRIYIIIIFGRSATAVDESLWKHLIAKLVVLFIEEKSSAIDYSGHFGHGFFRQPLGRCALANLHFWLASFDACLHFATTKIDIIFQIESKLEKKLAF